MSTLTKTNQDTINLTLKLFNAVPSQTTPDWSANELSNENKLVRLLEYGITVSPAACHATNEILNYFKANRLTSEDLNKTFHKSWKKIKNSTREELLVHQILHYFTTYGTDFQSEYVYIPYEKLEIPENDKIAIKIIHGLTEHELIEKCLNLFRSGIALAEDTVDDVLALLDQFKYQFKTVDDIRNKEALVKIVARKGIYPSSPTEFLRYLLYDSIGSTLLIKSKKVVNEIKESKTAIAVHVNNYGIEKCAEIFNRFKPLWLAFKSNSSNRLTINKISKLSKVYHRPLKEDILNNITSTYYTNEQILVALQKALPFRKIRLLYALNTRLQEATAFLYRIRNGKSYVKEQTIKKTELKYFRNAYDLVYNDLIRSVNLTGKKIAYPTNIDYALPATEKMFIGNVPTGTKIKANKHMAAGIYWKTDWGADDLDLSGQTLYGKVGWNASYNQGKGQLMYSGDITRAGSGAVELLYIRDSLESPALIMNNIYRGEVGCKFKIIVGNAPKVSKNHTFDPNELLLEVETEMKTRQQILGLFLPEKGGASFILINTGFGNMQVSSGGNSDLARAALFYQYCNPISMKQFLLDAGAELVEIDNEELELDLNYQNVTKETFINLFVNE